MSLASRRCLREMSRGLDEIEANLRRREDEQRRARQVERDYNDRRLEHQLLWNREVAELTFAALATIHELGLRVEERDEPTRVERVRCALAAWHAAGGLEPIDEGGEGGDWTPADYRVLRLTLSSEGGRHAYQRSLHWRRTSSAQRELVVFCERCGTVEGTRHAHHLHYETVGCERLRVDLMTLCRTCHLDKEHGSRPFLPGVDDDIIPF